MKKIIARVILVFIFFAFVTAIGADYAIEKDISIYYGIGISFISFSLIVLIAFILIWAVDNS